MALGCRFSEHSCHFVNLISLANNYFFLSLKQITWLKSLQPKNGGHVDHPRRYEIPLQNSDLESQVRKGISDPIQTRTSNFSDILDIYLFGYLFEL